MTSTSSDSLQRLQGLRNDLFSLSATTLPNIDRLSAELESRTREFRHLLEKKPENDKSRRVKLEHEELTVNDDFKQQAIQVADALDLDEIESAKLFYDALQDAQSLDRSPLASSIFLFHQLRQYSLECLRLLFDKAADEEIDEGMSMGLQNFISLLFQTDAGRPRSGSKFWHRCLEAMADAEKKLHHIADRIQTVSMTDQSGAPEFAELMDFQRSSLTAQHASLGAIAHWLARGNHTDPEDVRLLIERLRSFERYDIILVHYLPCLFQSLLQFGSINRSSSLENAGSLHEIIISAKDSDSWGLRNLHAAAVAIWLAEYSARFPDEADYPHDAPGDTDGGAKSLSLRFVEALNDGALHFILAVSHDIKDNDWIDPARQGFVTYLVQDAPNLQTDPFRVPDFLPELVLEPIQLFVEAFITNMPDTLRILRFEEDEQRRQMRAMVQLRSPEYDIHFERFLLVVACAFEGFPDAAEGFWEEADSPLFGFLEWASQRQSTPRVAAFCEMLSALAEQQECADSAHRFLLDEVTRSTTKLRRGSSLSWNHIFRELEFYASSIRDRPVQAGSRTYGARSQSDQFVEPESAIMLECYLRLITRICKESPAARAWLLSYPLFHIHEHLLQLCSSSIESRLRACAFAALSSLLTAKDQEINDGMWNALDAWVSGNTNFGYGFSRPTDLRISSAQSERTILESISQGFEEPNAFVGLLKALVEPVDGAHFLKDSLPFPEALGSTYKIPGIEPYIDFALGLVFAPKSKELHDPLQLRIMRHNCLGFAYSCLVNFNEELVVFANRSNINIDSAIQVSSLDAYIRIHPFARTMEWFFNDSVISALFSTACQDVKEVALASADSPLILGLTQSIQVIDLIMTEQPTYFDVVRPRIKKHSPNRRHQVANSALASFEDAILNNLHFVTNLALYCGSGHDRLVNASLKLLQKLSSSRKLTAPLGGPRGRQIEQSRLISQLDQDREGDNVSRALFSEIRVDERELEQGPQCPGYVMKTHILDFLNSSLDVARNHPTIAHLLLGFTCGTSTLDVLPDTLFFSGASLFHGLTAFLMDCPVTDGDTFSSWLVLVRNSAWQVMEKLWRSSVSSHLVMAELRAQDFFFAQALRQSELISDTKWDKRVTSDTDFLISSSAEGCLNYFQTRSSFLDYSAVELRLVHEQGLGTSVSRMQATMFGSTSLSTGESVQNPSILDFLDFLDLDFGSDWNVPESRFFDVNSLRMCAGSAKTPGTYDLSIVTQLLGLRRQEVFRSGKLLTPEDEQQIQVDMDQIYLCLLARNNQSTLHAARIECLHSWVRLVIIILECCKFEPAQRTAFTLQLLEVSLARLERLIGFSIEMASIFARFVRSVIYCLDFSSLDHAAIDIANDKLLHVYRVCLNGIQNADTTADLRDMCSQICQAYLRGITEDEKRRPYRKQALQCIILIGSDLTEILCEEAFAREGQSRVSCLALLEAMVTVANQEHSKIVVTLFNRINFIQVMVNHITSIPLELQNMSGEGAVALALSHHDASLSLLRTIAQTRPGAAQILSSDFFSSVRDSGIFSADPDIGLDIHNPTALTKYLELTLQLARIILSVVLSMGPQNDGTVTQARRFLHEYRPAIVGIFKRNAHIGSVAPGNEGLLEELVDCFTVLIEVVGFLETDEGRTTTQKAARLYT